jgi:hypothetical protein
LHQTAAFGRRRRFSDDVAAAQSVHRSHLSEARAAGTSAEMAEPPRIDGDDESALILALTRIEAKLDEFLRLLEEGDGGEEEPDA